MRASALLLGVGLSVSAVAYASEGPQDFAYAVPIDVPEGSGLARVNLSGEVYEGMVRAGLEDVRVFDREGQVMPHAIEPALEPATTVRDQELRLFPIYSHGRVAWNQSRLSVRTRGEEVTVQLLGQALPGGGAERLLRGYLIDLGADQAALSGLTFHWVAGAEHQLLTVTVEQSDDLSQWQVVVEGASLARMQANGRELVRDTVEFTRIRTRYLRLTFGDTPSVPSLTAVQGKLEEGATAAPRQWKDVGGRSHAPGGWEFDLGGGYPVDRLQWVVPGASAILPVSILSRSGDSEPWRPVSRTTFYRIEQGARYVSNPDLRIVSSRHQYWQVLSDRGAASLPAMTLRVGWVPDRLVFVMQGKAPYRLAFGNARAVPSALPIASVVPGFGTALAARIVDGRPGPRETLAGPDALARPVDGKKVSIWAALLAGVGLLGWMAWSLAKQMQGAQSGK